MLSRKKIAEFIAEELKNRNRFTEEDYTNLLKESSIELDFDEFIEIMKDKIEEFPVVEKNEMTIEELCQEASFSPYEEKYSGNCSYRYYFKDGKIYEEITKYDETKYRIVR